MCFFVCLFFSVYFLCLILLYFFLEKERKKAWSWTGEGKLSSEYIIWIKYFQWKKRDGSEVIRKLPYNSNFLGKANSLPSAKGYVASLDRQVSKKSHQGPCCDFAPTKGSCASFCLMVLHCWLIQSTTLDDQNTTLSTQLQC